MVARNKEAEAAHIQKIVTTRGEGLTDLLMMKKDFDRHTTKVSAAFFRNSHIIDWRNWLVFSSPN